MAWARAPNSGRVSLRPASRAARGLSQDGRHDVDEQEAAPSCGPRKCPSSRVLARMMTITRDQVSKGDAVTIATIEAAVPALVTAHSCSIVFRQ